MELLKLCSLSLFNGKDEYLDFDELAFSRLYNERSIEHIMNSLPNIVFIVADQMKASALKMYSDIGIETPNLEKLAQHGVKFENAITPHPLCVPARVSMMTSRYPHSTGSRRNETLMPSNQLHAFRIWKELGYTTGLFGKNHCFIQNSDLDLIDVRCELSHMGLPANDYLGEIGGTKGMQWVVPESIINESHSTRKSMRSTTGAGESVITEHPIEGYSSRAIPIQVASFLERAAKGDNFNGTCDISSERKPFTIVISFPDPHHPNECPKEFRDMVPPQSIKLAPIKHSEYTGPNVPQRNAILYEILKLDGKSDDEIKEIISTYLALTKFVDDGIGRIVEKLEQLSLIENTIIVFTSDHGDFAGEHNMFGKGGVFYDSLVKVPLIVSWKGKFSSQGQVDKSLVNTIDILPTLLQLTECVDFLNPQPVTAAQDVSDVGPVVSSNIESKWVNPEMMRRFQGMPLPTVTKAEPRIAAFSEYGSGGKTFSQEDFRQLPTTTGSAAIFDSLWARESEGRRKMVRTCQWKYVTDLNSDKDKKIKHVSTANDGDELYDLINDPWELNNVAFDSKNIHIISVMRRYLLEWMVSTEDYNPVPLPNIIGRGPKPIINTKN